MRGGGKSGLGVGPIKFELPVIHTNGAGKQAIAHISLEFTGEVRAEYCQHRSFLKQRKRPLCSSMENSWKAAVVSKRDQRPWLSEQKWDPSG